MAIRRPFNLRQWINENRDLLKPPKIMKGLGYYQSPLGDIEIASTDNKIAGVQFVTSGKFTVTLTLVVKQCIAELNDYFLHDRKFFSVELLLSGSVFQNKVWNEFLPIPYGKTVSYLDLALRIGDVNAVRAHARGVPVGPLLANQDA